MKERELLKHKRILITGAAGGLGQELCLAFGRRGAVILALDIHPKHLESLKRLLKDNNIQCEIYVCNIADKQQCKAVIKKIESLYSSIDMVIHNAGISHRSTFMDTKLEVLENIISVNVNGTINLTHFTLNQIMKNKGSYVVVSSVAGFAPLMGRTGYAASKHALHGFFETLRAEVEDYGVKILMVCPSFMKTAMEHTAFDGDGKQVSKNKQTVGNVLTPVFVAEQIVKGVLSSKKRIYISPIAKFSLIFSRLIPDVYNKIMKRRMIAEFKQNPEETKI
ncbi:SDR family oxidoreductase [Bacillus sp. AK031]